MRFSIHNRAQYISQLQSESYDVVIIGGGVTGAGALLDAQTRGLKACLVEMQDFSEGTSSRSTKLIHGGLRYLKQGDLKIVAEVGKERNTLYKNAPHLTQPTEVIIPFVTGGSMSRFSAKIAMLVYEFLANVESRFRHKMLRKQDVLNLVPGIKKEGLKGGVIYYEYKTNDSRLVVENIKKAVSEGAIALNYLQATAFEYHYGKICSVFITDILGQKKFKIKTKTVVSAVGPWTDGLIQLDNVQTPNKVVLTKGVHISLSKATFGLEHAVYFEVGDGRMVFAIPKFDNVYVGTTDTFYTQEKSNPSIDKADVQYILDAINRNFEQTKLTFADVKGAWAGLRPLVKEEGKGETEISRKDEIFVTESKLIAIAGGKLTGYRKMAEKVVDLVVKSLDMNAIACRTETMCLLGFETQHESVFIHYAAERGMQKLDAERMYHWFGKQAYTVLEYPSVQNLPDFLGKSLSYSFENEMITNPLDFLIHRTQIPYFDLELSLKYLPFVTNYLAKKEVPNLREEMYYIEKLHFLAAFKN